MGPVDAVAGRPLVPAGFKRAVGIRRPPTLAVSYVPAFLRLFEWLSVRKRGADLATLRARVSPSPAVRLLDVGGGAGAATERYASGCGEVVVLEPDPRKVALGRRLRGSIRFMEGRGEAMPFPDETFDWVVSIVALHHMHDPEAALREMRRVLRPSGRLAVMELPPDRSPGLLGRWLAAGKHGGRLEFLGPEAWQSKVEAAGFRDAAWETGVAAFFVTGAR